MTISQSDILKARILVVEERGVSIPLLAQLLGEAGYSRVTSTFNPQEVCALHLKHSYDLVLLDLKMPGMDGFQIMAGLQAVAGDGYLPVIVLTSEPENQLRARQAGAKDIISRPLDVIDVRARIHNMLEVRLLYKALENYNQLLEKTVLERTVKLVENESRFRGLTELACDWYWEQDTAGDYTTVTGPVLNIVGIRVTAFFAAQTDEAIANWNQAESQALQAMFAAQQPFLAFSFSRINTDGSRQQFRASDATASSSSCKFVGFRGIGADTIGKRY